MARSVSEWTMPETGVVPPLRMFAEVRAIAPVAGRPQKNGHTMFARPWAISSVFALCRSLMRPSATTAESSDSMEPRIAIVHAGAISPRMRSMRDHRTANGGKLDGIAFGPNRMPTVATPWACDQPRAAIPTLATTVATMIPGSRLQPNLGQTADEERAGQACPRRKRVDAREVGPEPGDLVQELPRQGRTPGDAEEVRDLAQDDRDRDAGREPARDRVRDELDHGPHPGQAHDDEHDPGHDGRQEEPVVAVALDDQEHDRHEGGRRAGDLHPAAAEGRDDEPGDDRREEPDGGRGNGVAAPKGTLATPSARASGSAISPTVTPPITSPRSFPRV